MLSAADYKGLYAILPTPARPGANRLDAVNTVDLEESARVVNRLIIDGVSGIIILGTTGECATLSHTDYEAFAGCVLETVARRVPTIVGATALGGHEVARRMKFVRANKADGVLLGLPMWQPVTTDMAVKYYAEVSRLFPELSIMVYANSRAFRYAFPPEFWQAVSREAPTVSSAKYSRAKNLVELQAMTQNRIHFMPNESTVQNFFADSPKTTTSCWATAAAMGPQPALAMMNAVARGDAAAVKAIAADIAWTHETVKPIISNPEIFASYNIQLEKIRIDEAGYCRAGPIRPPYDHMPPDYEAGAKECGRRWRTLCEKYAKTGAGETGAGESGEKVAA
ncbi:MAG: aldolase [Betaproteobacteria bacterium]|nr:aldolase [Betaproteobacteria bacterium]